MINPIWLRSFCTLVELGHFTRTAEALYMTQSGVSQHIRKLEEYLDQPLLIREGKSFTLTNAGDRLYHEGQTLILSLSNLEKQVGLDPTHEGIVRLASPGSVGLKLYPQLLQLQKQYPKLIIDYRFAPNSDIEILIAEHKIDIGIMTCPASLKEVSLEYIAEEELLLATPADVIKPTWEQLLTLGFIDHPDGAYHAGQLLSVNFPEFQNSDQFKCNGFSNQIHLILEPVSLGLGFTILPSHAVDAFAAVEKVNTHRLAHPVSEKLYIGTHRHKFLSNRMKTVIAEAENGLSNI